MHTVTHTVRALLVTIALGGAVAAPALAQEVTAPPTTHETRVGAAHGDATSEPAREHANDMFMRDHGHAGESHGARSDRAR